MRQRESDKEGDKVADNDKFWGGDRDDQRWREKAEVR